MCDEKGCFLAKNIPHSHASENELPLSFMLAFTPLSDLGLFLVEIGIIGFDHDSSGDWK